MLKIKIMPLLCGLLASHSALGGSVPEISAGTKDGGGGGVYLCRDSAGQVQKALLADLWEATETPFRWPHKRGAILLNRTQEAAQIQYARALAKLASADPVLAAEVEKERKAIWGNVNFLREEMMISVPDDLKVGYYPRGCPVEGLMYYNNESDQLDLKLDLFGKLETATDVAAAWMHEALYKILRDQGYHDTSKYARRLNACLFSQDPDCLAEKVEIPTDRVRYECSDGTSTVVTIYPEKKITSPDKLKERGLRLIIAVLRSPLKLTFTPTLSHEVYYDSLSKKWSVGPSDGFKSQNGQAAYHMASWMDFSIDMDSNNGGILNATFGSYRRFHPDDEAFNPSHLFDKYYVRNDQALECRRVQ